MRRKIPITFHDAEILVLFVREIRARRPWKFVANGLVLVQIPVLEHLSSAERPTGGRGVSAIDRGDAGNPKRGHHNKRHKSAKTAFAGSV